MKDTDGTKTHLREHMTYPASKADLVAACNNLDHFSAEDKAWFSEHLSDKTYNSADEVITELGI